MKVDMLMPQMGESITEATISKWLKNVGDTIEKDEIVLEISTDKVDSEIPAPAAGTLSEVLFKEGDVVPVKSKIAIIDSEASSNGAKKAAEPAKETKEPEQEKTVEEPTKPSASAQVQNGSSSTDSDRFYSPLVKSLAEKHGVVLSELDSVKGSGQGGRLNKSDFLNYLESKDASVSTSTPSPTAKKAPQQEVKQNIDWESDGSKVIPMNNMRQAIAAHMVRSKHTSPHVYSVQEVDMTAVSKWRARNKQKFTEKHGFNLSFTPFFLEATVQALLSSLTLTLQWMVIRLYLKRM